METKTISTIKVRTNLLRSGVKPSEVFAWACLDFANSGYTTVVLTAVFNAYFVSTIMEGSTNATLIWTSILSVSYLLVMITAPLLGAYADSHGTHKIILFWATISCSLTTICLGFSTPGSVFLAGVLLVVSNLSYSVHQDITASYLVNFCESSQLGKMSGFGWAWGFVGGITTLILCLLWVFNAAFLLGTPTVNIQTKVSGAMVITGSIFAFISFFALLNLGDFKYLNTNSNWKTAWTRTIKALGSRKKSKDLFDFLFCVFIYQSGIAIVITVAAIYAKEVMNFSVEQTISMILVVNFSACIGAFVFGFLQDKIGHKKSIFISLIFWLITVAMIFFAESSQFFWIAANFAGLAMGASQSGARAAVAYMSPVDKQAENFGLWGVSINAASVLGPFLYGLATFFTNNNHRISILLVGVFFLTSIFLLIRCKFRPPAQG